MLVLFFFFFFFTMGCLSLLWLVGTENLSPITATTHKKKKISTHRHQIKNLTSHTQILSLNVIPPLLPSPLYFHTNSIYPFIMRPLTEEETKVVFEKLANYIGRNISFLIDNPENPHVFRLQKDRVYYVQESIAKFATSVSRQQLMSLGTCFGKFTKTGKFRLHITSLPYLAQYAKFKIWIKQNGEIPFLYGNHVLKAHIGRMSDDIPEHAGVIIYSMNDIPLGFGASAKSTAEARNLPPTGIVAFRQGDIGEYLREEDTLFT